MSDNSPVTAVAYSVATETVFWTAGKKLWKASLNASSDSPGELIGELTTNCSVNDMAYDWVNENFFFVCDAKRIVVCHARAETTGLFCAEVETMPNMVSIAVEADKR